MKKTKMMVVIALALAFAGGAVLVCESVINLGSLFVGGNNYENNYENNYDDGKTITIKGVGSASVKPDWVNVSINIKGESLKYKEAFNLANKSIELLQKTVVKLGFEESDLKTLDFNVREEWRYIQETGKETGKNVFDGYCCSYALDLSFDFDMEKLADVMTQLATCGVNPKLELSFTVKDKSVIADELLVSATNDAKRKAEILANAANAELCELVSIDYNWSEVSFFSRTNFCNDDALVVCAEASAPRITPDNIRARDSATFVWRIKSH